MAGIKEVLLNLLGEGEVLGKVGGELASIDPGAPPPGSGDMEKATYDPDENGVIAIAQGGTGATTAGGARTALGLGTAAVEAAGAFDAAGAAAAAQAAAEDTAADELAGHAAAADPHTGYQKESEKGSASGYAGLDANSRVASTIIQVGATARVIGRKTGGAGASEECTLSEVLDFVGSAAHGDILYRGASAWARLAAGADGDILTTHGGDADPTWETPSGGSNPAFWGNIYGAFGDCNPTNLMRFVQNHGTSAPTPTNITTSIARCCFFRPPADITVNRIRFYGVGNTTGFYRVAIYRYSDLARVAVVNDFNTAAATWGSLTVSVSLTAGTLYFIAVTVDGTSTTAGIAAMGPTIAATTGQIQTAPGSLPGGLDADNGFLDGYCFQFAVTSGALPDPAATLAAQAAWTGGMPAFWLDASSA